MPDRPHYRGILCIGDLHLASRPPGFRKDDYPRAMLKKLKWSLDYAREEQLLPVFLGDLFHYPRDNANWLLVESIGLLGQGGWERIGAIAGNHDCTEDQLSEHDTLSILVAAGCVRLLDREPWTGTINGQRVHIGGSPWNTPLPSSLDRAALGEPRLVMWLTHHDLSFGGRQPFAPIDCHEIPGVDLVINGHIHNQLEDVLVGRTRWCNPGSLARVTRADAAVSHAPGVLRIDIDADGWTTTRVTVPHEPFENVFHPQMESDDAALAGESLFITGLASLQQLKTAGGEGLREFLDRNLHQFQSLRVQDEIKALAEEVLGAR